MVRRPLVGGAPRTLRQPRPSRPRRLKAYLKEDSSLALLGKGVWMRSAWSPAGAANNCSGGAFV